MAYEMATLEEDNVEKGEDQLNPFYLLVNVEEE